MEPPIGPIRRRIDVVVDVTTVRHERAHVQIFREGDECRDLFMESIGMFEALCREKWQL